MIGESLTETDIFIQVKWDQHKESVRTSVHQLLRRNTGLKLQNNLIPSHEGCRG